MSEPLELSCYTANLVSYLEPRRPTVRSDLADAIRLSVRTDPPEGGMAFSHHTRVDLDSEGSGLVYRGADDWPEARAALRTELERHGRVLAVGNTRYIPWSPSYGGGETPHWVLLSRYTDGEWTVTDDFAALTPHGGQDPYAGLLDGQELRRILSPPDAVTPEAANRDRYALGQEVRLPAVAGYRWLERTAVERSAVAAEPAGAWVHGLVPALRFVANRVCSDGAVLARYADDLWTASRHQRYRLAADSAAGKADPEVVARAADSWAELPRAVRFAVASAERGRFRAGLVEKAFTRVLDTMVRLEKGSVASEG